MTTLRYTYVGATQYRYDQHRGQFCLMPWQANAEAGAGDNETLYEWDYIHIYFGSNSDNADHLAFEVRRGERIHVEIQDDKEIEDVYGTYCDVELLDLWRDRAVIRFDAATTHIVGINEEVEVLFSADDETFQNLSSAFQKMMSGASQLRIHA